MQWKEIEDKWQRKWNEAKIFECDPDPKKKKVFITFPFPYMNGPLHVGHAFTAARLDAYARYMRMKGFNVLFPWAWHWTGETIAGASERVKKKDPAMIREFKELDGVPEEEIEKFIDPVYIAKYYTENNRDVVKKIGFSIDWRREFHTTSLEPTFSRFIEWQYEKLKESGYVFKGTHPVIWCPNCESPTGDHDRLEGEGVAPEEYILIKFRYNDAWLPAATFRPETIFGVTNLWLNPDAKYVKAKINGETWIVSEEAAKKLGEQLKKVEILGNIKGKELIGKKCFEPLNQRELLILPGWFVDPNNGSGVVYSVPAHAPFDWIALRDLKKKPELFKEFGISEELVANMEPISMISSEGFGEFPAIEIVDQLNVKDQHDEKCDKATKILYKKEFHSGILKPICGEYADQKVNKVKNKLIEDFKKKKIIDLMYDIPEDIVCRCTTPCLVKILKGQWFLRYSDPDWKKKTHELLDNMKVFPESARQWFHDVIDWYKDWACARRTGLGTPLPWSKNWIVETLSDSTIYMAFYTIRKDIVEYRINEEQLTDEVFNFVFFGDGNLDKISKDTGIDQKALKSMREEFLYFYPVDLRNSAKELLPNHLTFFLFQHSAFFDSKLWPKAVAVNGMLMIEGNKMSKSKGNIITIGNALENEGADITRCALLFGGENMDDPDWRQETLREVRDRLNSFFKLSNETLEMKGESKPTHLERWLLSVIQNKIEKVEESIDELRTRTALENALYEIWKDFRWYLRRVDKCDPKIAKEFINIWIRLLSPFIPHLCEELWQKIGEKEFVSTAKWPIYDKSKIDLVAEEKEDLIRDLLEDTNDITKVMKSSPNKIIYYSSATWKWNVVFNILGKKDAKIGDIIKQTMQDKELSGKVDKKEIVNYVKKTAETINRLPNELKDRKSKAGIISELETIQNARSFLEKELNCKIDVYIEDDANKYDPSNKANVSQPYRPGIYIE